jgi:flagellar basal-body rod protein FlgG
LIDVISNNIANSSTPGFKKTQLNFVDLVYQSQAAEVSAGDSIDSSNGAGVKVMSTTTDFSVGDLKQTGNPFDIAIQGNGFIEVELEDGEYAYTRAGRMRLDNDVYLVTSEGNRLSSSIQLPPDMSEFYIEPDGTVSARVGESNELITMGEIELTRFASEDGLVAIGNNIYAASETSGDAIYSKPGEQGTGTLLQGITEISNVSMTEEMVNLMLAQRGYQLNARIIQVSDQLLDTINNLRR